MEVIFFLIPIALLFVAVGVWLFFWAVDNGQFDDLDSPAHRILFEDEPLVDQKQDSRTAPCADSDSSTAREKDKDA